MKNCSQDTGEAPRHLRMASSSWIPVGIITGMTADQVREKGERQFGIAGYKKFCEEWNAIKKDMIGG